MLNSVQNSTQSNFIGPSNSKKVARRNRSDRYCKPSDNTPKVSPNICQSQISMLEKFIEKDAVGKESLFSSTGKRIGDAECPIDITKKNPKISLGFDSTFDEENENRDLNYPSNISPTQLQIGARLPTSGDSEKKLISLSRKDSMSIDTTVGDGRRSLRLASAAPFLSSPQASTLITPRPFTSAVDPSDSCSSAPHPQPNLSLPKKISPLSGGFRCNICRYRGQTLGGMWTHMSEHSDVLITRLMDD